MIDERMLRGGHYAAEVSPAAVYRERRRHVQHHLEDGAVAVFFGASDARGYGDVGTFRQEPTFFYLTGVELPGAVLVLERERETLFLPSRRPNLEAWTGPKLGPGEESARELGFDEVCGREAGEVIIDARRRPCPNVEDRIAAALAGAGPLWLALPPASSSGPLSEELRFAQALRDRLPTFAVKDLTPIIREMRLAKDEAEITLIRKAVGATVAAMRAAARAARPGAGEAAVDGAAFAALRAAGADGWAFPPIVGSGQAGCVLHYDANRGVLAEGELLVVDIGARWGYYCGDLTRTFPVGGRFSPRQRDLYRAVLAAHEAAAETLRPGATIGEARKAAFGSLEASGLTGDGGASLGQFFIHGIGHFLGLETHDVGGEEPLLRAGMVVTIEPGVYLPGEGVAVRIEDDYLVTDRGAACLSADLPRALDEVEAMVAG